MVGLAASVAQDLQNPNSVFVLFIASLFVMAALMHPREFWYEMHSRSHPEHG